MEDNGDNGDNGDKHKHNTNTNNVINVRVYAMQGKGAWRVGLV